MQVPILSGISTDALADYRSAYPRNMVPIPKKQGVSNGYLRPGEGILPFTDASGIDRGGFNWKGKCYRVLGRNFSLIEEDGSEKVIAALTANLTGNVSIINSFDYLAICDGQSLYLYDGQDVQRVTDEDLGPALDATWLDGYFVTTDGEFIVTTELNDPFAVNPFKYGSSEIDPDPIVGVKKLRNELIAINRYTVEYFDNVGVSAENQFAFQRISGAELQRGCIGTHASAIFDNALAFIGGGRSEDLAVWIGRNGADSKLSTREVDIALAQYGEDVLANVIVEARRVRNHDFLYIHLPNQTWVFDLSASTQMGVPVWHTLDSGTEDIAQYRAHNFVFCYGKWIAGDPTGPRLGLMTNEISSHYGDVVNWEFSTMALFNEGYGAIVHEVKLTGLTGRVAEGTDPEITTSYSLDGETWSEPKIKRVGKNGSLRRDLTWYRQGSMTEVRMQRFQGSSDAFVSIARLDMKVEGLTV